MPRREGQACSGGRAAVGAVGVLTETKKRPCGRFFSNPRAPDRQRRLRAGRGYYFNAAVRGAGLLRRQSRGWLGIYKIARQNTFVLYDYIKKALSNQDKADFSEKNIKTGKTLTSR